MKKIEPKSFGNIGCYVKMRGNKNKHKVIVDEHIGNGLPNCVTVLELCSGEKTNTTWSKLSEWKKNHKGMKTHKLKTVQPYFDACWSGAKNFEVRENDRDFNEGDIVYLQEYDVKEGVYSGRELECEILYVLRNFHAIESNYVVFSFSILQHIDKKHTLIISTL